jgi:hypothetical protein
MKEEMNEKKEWVTPEIVDLDLNKTASGSVPAQETMTAAGNLS